jgi:platelet-activating factor acetylhydrolase
MAASGKVVLAIEHRDGTGPVVVDSRGEPKLYIQEDQWMYAIYVISVTNANATNSWDPTKPQPSDPLPMRADQLRFRRKEIYQIYTAFKDLVNGVRGEPDDVFKLNVLDGANVDLKCWEGVVNCEENVGLVGHSFGGATLVCIPFLSFIFFD